MDLFSTFHYPDKKVNALMQMPCLNQESWTYALLVENYLYFFLIKIYFYNNLKNNYKMYLKNTACVSNYQKY